jgi:AraC-like DNA-binding protein
VTPFASLHTHEIESFEELNEIVLGTQREIVQIERGKIHGRLSHASIGALPIDLATFNLGLRSNGALPSGRIAIGMLAESSNRVTRSSYESQPGDVLVTVPGAELQNRYYSGASIFVISITSADIESSFGTEGQLGDPTTWVRSHFKGSTDTVRQVVPFLQSLFANPGDGPLDPQGAEFWKRAVIEAMTANIVKGTSSVRDGPLPSALKMVRQIEEYLDERAPGPVHISEICSHLHVSRRTLHRVFHETLGIGPVGFLRHRRLCAAHTALRAREDIPTISDIALQHGFQNLGRFAGYYHQLFGEYPSETRRRCA